MKISKQISDLKKKLKLRDQKIKKLKLMLAQQKSLEDMFDGYTKVITKATPCKKCRGSGKSDEYFDPSYGHGGGNYLDCSKCKGWGTK